MRQISTFPDFGSTLSSQYLTSGRAAEPFLRRAMLSSRHPTPELTLIPAPRGQGGLAGWLQSAPAVALGMVAMWAIAGAAFSSAQWGDHFERFTWAHGVQWGHHKHPPLPTRLVAAAIALFASSVESARALAWAVVLPRECGSPLLPSK